MKRKETLRHLQLLVNHPDARVRTALAYAYNDFGELKKSSSFLNDSDQDVRIKVLQLFTIRPYARIYSELLRKIKAKQFQLLDYNEQKEFISCLVANGDAKLLKSLERMLFKRKIFGAKNYRNMRRLAALGLSQIGTDEAMKILENGLNKKNKDIKMACEMVTKSR